MENKSWIWISISIRDIYTFYARNKGAAYVGLTRLREFNRVSSPLPLLEGRNTPASPRKEKRGFASTSLLQNKYERNNLKIRANIFNKSSYMNILFILKNILYGLILFLLSIPLAILFLTFIMLILGLFFGGGGGDGPTEFPLEPLTTYIIEIDDLWIIFPVFSSHLCGCTPSSEATRVAPP